MNQKGARSEERHRRGILPVCGSRRCAAPDVHRRYDRHRAEHLCRHRGVHGDDDRAALHGAARQPQRAGVFALMDTAAADPDA